MVESGSQLAGNSASGSGGGIFNAAAATATVSGSTLAANSATGTSSGGGYGSGGYGSGSYGGGSTPNPRPGGGGIYNVGNLTVEGNTTVSGNSATTSGGGIDNTPGATANVSGSTIAGNTTTGSGGGIENDGTLIVQDGSTIAGNAAKEGGGIENPAGAAANVSDSTIANNATTDAGGGIDNTSGTLSVPGLTLVRCTVSGNTAALGGGVRNTDGGSVIAINTTVAYNVATGENTAGGIDDEATSGSDTTVELRSCTIAGNTTLQATKNGSQLSSGRIVTPDNTTGAADITFQNTIILGDANGEHAGRTYVLGTGKDKKPGTLTSAGNNLCSDNSCGLKKTLGDLPSTTDPVLTSLGDYGGPTLTMGLLPESPAIYAGRSDPLALTDQRGVTRSLATPDIGAFESQGFTIEYVSGDFQDTQVGTDFPENLVVALTSLDGVPVPSGIKVTFTAMTGTGGASTTPAVNSATIDSSGQASVTVKANSKAGTFHVDATAPDVVNLVETYDFTLTNDAKVQLPTIAIDNVQVTEGDGGMVPAVFTVTLSAPSDQDVTVAYKTQNGTAKAGKDYVATSGTLVIPAGTLDGTINVEVNGNQRHKKPRSFSVVLSNPTNGKKVAQGTCTITYTRVFDDSDRQPGGERRRQRDGWRGLHIIPFSADRSGRARRKWDRRGPGRGRQRRSRPHRDGRFLDRADRDVRRGSCGSAGRLVSHHLRQRRSRGRRTGDDNRAPSVPDRHVDLRRPEDQRCCLGGPGRTSGRSRLGRHQPPRAGGDAQTTRRSRREPPRFDRCGPGLNETSFAFSVALAIQVQGNRSASGIESPMPNHERGWYHETPRASRCGPDGNARCDLARESCPGRGRRRLRGLRIHTLRLRPDEGHRGPHRPDGDLLDGGPGALAHRSTFRHR